MDEKRLILSHQKVKVDSIFSKCVLLNIILCVSTRDIYYIKLKSLVEIHKSFFKHVVSMYTFVFLYELSYIGGLIS